MESNVAQVELLVSGAKFRVHESKIKLLPKQFSKGPFFWNLLLELQSPPVLNGWKLVISTHKNQCKSWFGVFIFSSVDVNQAVGVEIFRDIIIHERFAVCNLGSQFLMKGT